MISSLASTDEIAVDGLAGFEQVVDAEDTKSGDPLVLYQVVLFDGDSYFLFQGRAAREQAAEVLPEFKAMARSFKRTRE
ncbi:MAG: hypothetical protein HYY93_06260 [Planctomycetes bacterium]|nr:hypothetical protein [Planctomycetota bacterium]